MRRRSFYMHRRERRLRGKEPKRPRIDVEMQTNAAGAKVLYSIIHPSTDLYIATYSELLIDVTSHELRQPVSAILNCSALVRENLGKLRDELFECYMTGSSFLPQEELLNAMDEDLDALDSIYQVICSFLRVAIS